MKEWLDTARESMNQIHPWLVPASGLLLLVLVAWLVDIVVKKRLIALAKVLAGKTRATWDDVVIEHRVIERLTRIIPAAAVYFGAPLIPDLADSAVAVLQNVAMAWVALMVVMAISALLSVGNSLYERREDAHLKPIKGYIQVAKLLAWILGIILVVAALIDKSPLILLSGFGALTAVLLLVFKDTILSLVASVQLSSLDMVRVGDWIEMPQYNADGDVIDVALHTIRVQNWDKTITTIPTHKLISDSFKNWRGMSESGGRRIKRALLIDMASVRFLNADEVRHFSRFALLKEYIDTKLDELEAYNRNLDRPTDELVNLRRMTNLGTFRAYVFNYLKNHPDMNDGMTLLVRQLQPQPEGIPIEIYCFTNTTAWAEYERIQSDLFDHILAIMSEFGLRAYQRPSGSDFSTFVNSGSARAQGDDDTEAESVVTDSVVDEETPR